MWRTYAGTFTPKKKSAIHHSEGAGASPSSSAPHKQRPHKQLEPRRSSSITSSLEDLIYRGEKRPEDEEAEGGTEQAEEQPAEEEEVECPTSRHLHPDQHSPSRRRASFSVFVDPTAPSVSAVVSQPQQPQRASPRARNHPQPQATNSNSEPQPQQVAGKEQHNTENRRRSIMRTTHSAQRQKVVGEMQSEMDSQAIGESNHHVLSNNKNTVLFEKSARHDRTAPKMPTTDGIEYPRAASWSSSTVAEIMRDPIGRQVFRCFLHEALAEENLLFVEQVEKLKKEKQPDKIRRGIAELLEQYGTYINLSSVAMSKLREATKAEKPDPKALDMAHKEIYKLLENDQFPRFRRSKLYLGFLEQLLPRSYAERWTTSFDALLGNQVGRHHFRQFLFSVHAEENLRFWESVIEFRQLRNKSSAMLNMGRTIQQQFLREGAHNEVFLPFGLRQRVEKKIREKDVDETLFDDAVKHVEQILKNDPYVRFLQSKDYNDLLAKLH